MSGTLILTIAIWLVKNQFDTILKVQTNKQLFLEVWKDQINM